MMSQSNQNHKEEDRVSAILRIMKEVEHSPLSVNQYFRENATPFSRCQYYLYKKVLDQRGIQGLYDQRKQGNNVKFTHDMKNFVLGMVKSNRSMACSELQQALTEEFGVTISSTVLNDFRREHGLSRTQPRMQESGASEMVIALALDSGFIQTITDAIYRSVQQKKASEPFRASLSFPKDHSELRSHGQFTPEYNRSPAVNASRFQSVEEKIDKKRLGSMEIFAHSRSTTMRYTVALLSLPLVTMNGRVQGVDHPRGNALQYLCGYNYKAATLTKYLSELKYLQMADEFIATTARFWIDFWGQRTPSETMFACYYIDGNTKALWSSKPCHKGKVTMLGRVMNCLEQVFIHDGYGHPIYFQTFNGHADLGKNALCMLDTLSDYLEETGNSDESLSITRILIFDGGGNGVKTLRGLCQSEYHFITILDANQVNDRKLKSVSPKKRYAYGDADVVDCVIELEDSHEKGYIFETRTVQVHWDNQRMCVLVTSLSQELCSPDNVVKSYFDRWPMQELNFKDLKSRVNIHRIVGYGKKMVDNTSVLGKIERLQGQIQGLEHALEEPLHHIRE
jgi:transposase